MTYNRRYDNYSTLLAFLGGLFGLSVSLFKIIGEQINKVAYEKEIADSIYNFEPINDRDKA